MSVPGDSQIMNYLVRMVVPMRREFGRQLDVQQFLRDAGYAATVLDEALASQDPRLREYAKYVQARIAGVRTAAPPAVPPASAGERAAPTSPPVSSDHADELRAKVMKKYTGGLR